MTPATMRPSRCGHSSAAGDTKIRSPAASTPALRSGSSAPDSPSFPMSRLRAPRSSAPAASICARTAKKFGSAATSWASFMARLIFSSYLSGGRRDFRALNLLAQEPHEHETWERDDESQKKERRPRQPQVLWIGRVAGDRTDVHAPEGGERREQRVLRGGEAMVAQRHQQRHERGRPHSPGDILEAHGEHHDRIALPDERKPHESEYRHRLQNSETEERAIKAEPHHQRAAEQHSDDGRGETDGLVDVAHVVQRKPRAAQ